MVTEPITDRLHRVLVVCHAGETIGLGHYYRSLTVSNSIKSTFHSEVYFLIQGDISQICDLSHSNCRSIDWSIDIAEHILSEYMLYGFDVVLFDLHSQSLPSYSLMSQMLSSLQSSGAKVIGIDGLFDFSSFLDLIFIPSIHIPSSIIEKVLCPLIYGWDCFLLNLSQKPLDWRPGNRILALSGGSDTTGLAYTLPEILDTKLPTHSELHWVTGPYSDHPSIPINPRINFITHNAPSGLGSLMSASNYAITVFGVSFFELLFLGVPTVVFSPYDGKDDEQLQAVSEAGVALIARDLFEASDQLALLLRDDDLAFQISSKARLHLNVPGTQRLCAEIMSMTNLSE